MPALDYITTAVNLIGIISFLSWVYAIGHKTNEKLKNNNITLTIFKYFNFGFMAMIASGVIMYILLITQDEVNITEKSGNMNYHISYLKPLALSLGVGLVLVISSIFIVLVAAKMLVSAEKNKEAKFGDYFTTLILFAISWLGVWWIQPRVQKL